ncbi:MAG: deaminase [Actinomycetota bacterium]|nr:deaminase [Actinomycetota bacterium]
MTTTEGTGNVPAPSQPATGTALQNYRPELAFALVRTLGSDISGVVDEVTAALGSVGYHPQTVKLSGLLAPARTPANEHERYELLMNAGDNLRQVVGRGDGVLLEGLRYIRANRPVVDHPAAWIIDSLVHPKEVETLHEIWGRRLFVIAIDSPRHSRWDSLTNKFQRRSGMTADAAQKAALHAINRDAGMATALDPTMIVPSKHRLKVAKTLEMADVFVRGDDPQRTRQVVRRLVECVFGHPFHTPTVDEFGMATAFQAAMTTSTLSRRVGAAIMQDGMVVATGTNEVPKASGGVYHAESDPDGREFVEGLDPSDQIRAQIVTEFLAGLRDEGWLDPSLKKTPVKELLHRFVNDPKLSESRVLDVIEYGRTTHAEMVAITGAARLGISLKGATLYTTTLPCHECTRNIIPVGLARVVYLEPYAKSRGAELQSDAVAMLAHQQSDAHKLSLEPFAGFAHHRFPELFSWVPRKQDDVNNVSGRAVALDGQAVVWAARGSSIRRSLFNPMYGEHEIFTQRLIEDTLLDPLPDEGQKEPS